MVKEEDTKEYVITIPAKQACELIKTYYKKYEGFNGEIEFRLDRKGFKDAWGFTDYYGYLKINFIEELKIGDDVSTITTTLNQTEIPTKKIFQPFFDEKGYELEEKEYFDIDVDAYGTNIRFNSLTLYAKKKVSEKVLRK